MHATTARTRSTANKLLCSAAALGVAAAVAGLGSWAAFTSSTSASTPVDSGTVTATLGAAGTAANRLTIGATGVAAGDTIERAVTLTNSGSIDWSAVALTTTASTSSALDTDATDGLQLSVDSCSVPWTEAGTAPAYTYTCSGTTTSVLASQAVIGASMALGSLASLTAGGSDELRVKLELPSTADNTFQGLSSTIDFTFTSAQRAGTNR